MFDPSQKNVGSTQLVAVNKHTHKTNCPLYFVNTLFYSIFFIRTFIVFEMCKIKYYIEIIIIAALANWSCIIHFSQMLQTINMNQKLNINACIL